MKFSTRIRSIAVSLVLLMAAIAPMQDVMAQTSSGQRALAGFGASLPPGRFVGQVTALTGPISNPTGMTLALGLDTVDIRFGLRYSPRPLSAEAEVEGLAVKDYVALQARRSRNGLVTQRVQFDVQPFGRLQLIAGSVQTVSTDSRHVKLRLADTGNMRWVEVLKQTRYDIDGKPAPGPVPIGHDQTLQVLVLKGDFNWVAADINIKQPLSGSRFAVQPH
jgi:hypothetical protein